MGVVFQKSKLPTILHFARVTVTPLPHVSKTVMGGGGGNSGGEKWETGFWLKPRIEGVFLPLSKRYGKRPYRLWSELFILLITR